MNITDRPAFDANIAQLFGALGKYLDEAAKEGWWSGLAGRMSSAEFGRCCQRIVQDVPEEGVPKTLHVGMIWEARKRLRVSAQPQAPERRDESPADPWDMARASRCGRHLCGNFPRYSHPADLPPQLSAAVLRSPDYRPHPISRELREPLYEAGRQWADAMRLQTRALGGAPNAADQEEFWRDVLTDAEPQVDAIRRRHDLEPVAAPRTTPARHTQPIASHMSDVIDHLGADEAEAA